MPKEKFYITTAIAYTSKKPHIGNTYEIVLTDSIARFKRMLGFDVFFLTGTDEHGQKIEELATAEGITPKQHVDKVAGQIREICDLMGATYDKFIRTTDADHEKVVQKIFKKLFDQGDIYKGEYEGMYCTPCESFWTESQLVDGKCPDCGRPCKKAKEEAYFLKLSNYTDRLVQYIENNDFITPDSRKKEMINNFIKPGLFDLCVSRTSFKWGIPVDFDPRHVTYVWLDALSNYITALGFDPDGSSDLYKKYWPADVHVIGKDILRFHTIYWPIILMALGQPLPKQIFGHGWLLFGNDKMSKSKGNVIYADELVDIFGVDAVRYYLLSEMPYAQDGSITYEEMIERYNTDLANTLGNLVNRTVAMIKKYFGGEIKAPVCKAEIDNDLLSKATETAETVKMCMDKYKVADALESIISLARRANKYIDETSPWALAKDEADSERLQTVLYNLAETIRFIGVLLTPFMPQTSEKILSQIGTDENTFESLAVFGQITAGTKTGVPAVLFARIDGEKLIEEMKAKTETANACETPQVKPVAEEITIDDFMKSDLRVGLVISCEKVKKSSKLLLFKIDDGMGCRQIVSGIATWYKPEDLIGKKIMFVANLKPVKLCGQLSEGMICSAELSDGSAKVMFADDSVPVGSKIR